MENGVICGAVCGIQKQCFGFFCDEHEIERQADYRNYKRYETERNHFKPEVDEKSFAFSFAQELCDRLKYSKKYCHNNPHFEHRVRNEYCWVISRHYFTVRKERNCLQQLRRGQVCL